MNKKFKKYFKGKGIDMYNKWKHGSFFGSVFVFMPRTENIWDMEA